MRSGEPEEPVEENVDWDETSSGTTKIGNVISLLK